MQFDAICLFLLLLFLLLLLILPELNQSAQLYFVFVCVCVFCPTSSWHSVGVDWHQHEGDLEVV